MMWYSWMGVFVLRLRDRSGFQLAARPGFKLNFSISGRFKRISRHRQALQYACALLLTVVCG